MVSIGVTVLADPEGQEEDRQLDRPEMEPDEEHRLARDDRLGDELRGVEGQALVDVRPGVTTGVRATSR